MAGIYIHIPFCRKACHYCNFHFSTSTGLKNDFTTALLKEIALQKEYLKGETIETVYFGGGTPSLLEEKELLAIMEQLHNNFTIANDAEVTLEANPDDISAEKLLQWRRAGVNRLSIGIQSFYDEDLQWMNRAHNTAQAISAVKAAQDAGFNNITIDLIYGTPLLTSEKWEANVNAAIELDIPHLSCYALTVEPGTALEKMIAQHKKENTDSEKQAHQFLSLMHWLEKSGYEHYEISNFAKPGWRSRHNTSYWQGKRYLGLGPSAHSFNRVSRQWNIANNALYIQSLLQNKVPFEEETLTATQQLNEYVMTSLRTMEGLDLFFVEKTFGAGARSSLLQSVQIHINRNQCNLAGEKIILTKEGKLFADGIAADLFTSNA